ncbi:MAG TPA: hypothetical protein VFF30_11300 [Nitrososphaerales archaeon]|nr:hypothetical protein [Nitrososphaerales archaeon]
MVLSLVIGAAIFEFASAHVYRRIIVQVDCDSCITVFSVSLDSNGNVTSVNVANNRTVFVLDNYPSSGCWIVSWVIEQPGVSSEIAVSLYANNINGPLLYFIGTSTEFSAPPVVVSGEWSSC